MPGTQNHAVEYCLNCDEVIKSPNTERKLLVGASLVSPVLFLIAYLTNDPEIWATFYAVGSTGILVLIHFFFRSRVRYKPIYDCWVHQHGTDAESWPSPKKPDS